jgi:hypothetical protein
VTWSLQVAKLLRGTAAEDVSRDSHHRTAKNRVPCRDATGAVKNLLGKSDMADVCLPMKRFRTHFWGEN